MVADQSEVLVGLKISLAPQWHIYWKNAGESGYPTTLHWSFSQQEWRAGKLQFPAPYLYEYEGMTGYALKNNLFYSIPCLPRLAPPALTKGSHLEGRFDALICNESTCLPYELEFSLQFEKVQRTKNLLKKIFLFLRMLRVKSPSMHLKNCPLRQVLTGDMENSF